jgi:mannitol-1-phosphate 5-dehydrogenase
VVIGAGRVGCGSVGLPLAQQGHEVVLVNRDGAVADRINRHEGYLVRVAEDGRVRPHRVSGVRALPLADRRAVVAAVAGADLIATAVGAGNLARVAPLIADGLRHGRPGRNVVAFENAADPGATLGRLVAARLGVEPAAVGPATGAPGTGGYGVAGYGVAGYGVAGHRVAGHGFAGGIVHRIVAHRLLDPDPAVPLEFLADGEHRLQVDRRGLVAALPTADGLGVVDDFATWVRAKLFTLNAAHAAAAYLGHLKGYRWLHAAVRDRQIRPVVNDVAALGRACVAARAGTPVRLPGPAAVLRRLDNAALGDTVLRVARDPLRKLAATERLAGSAVWAAEAGLWPDALALVMAAALRYARVGEGAASGAVVREVCGLDPTAGTGRLVLRHAERMAPVPPGAVAVDLGSMSWGWGADRPIPVHRHVA